MKITSIKQQVKRPDRYSVFVDDAYSFSLSEAALIRSGIASGQELSSGEIEAYKRLSEEDKIYGRALRYVAMRPRSVGEMRVYLRRKDVNDTVIADIVRRLEALGLLNDRAFAVSFVHDRQTLKPTSRRKITLELKKKYIAEEHITNALQAASFDDTDSLRQLIAKKRRQSKYQDDTRLMQYLARQGYGYSDIKRALGQDED